MYLCKEVKRKNPQDNEMCTTHLVVVLLLVILTLPYCNGGFDDCHNTIYFTNNSDKPIYAVSTLKKGFFNFDPTNEEYAADFKVRPGKTIKVEDRYHAAMLGADAGADRRLPLYLRTMLNTLKTKIPTG